MFNLFRSSSNNRRNTPCKAWSIHHINAVRPLDFQLKYVVFHTKQRIGWRGNVYIAYSSHDKKYFIKQTRNSEAQQFYFNEITILPS
jgi:hypothetical protein